MRAFVMNHGLKERRLGRGSRGARALVATLAVASLFSANLASASTGASSARLAAKADPNVVRTGRAVAVTGFVASAYIGSTVVLQRLDGTTWRSVGHAKVATSGTYVVTATAGAPGTATYRTSLAARAHHAALLSAAVRVRITRSEFTTTVAVAATSIPAAATTAVTGSVTPSSPGSLVELEVYQDGQWTVARTGRLSAQSRYAFSLAENTPGHYWLRVVKPNSSTIASGLSVRTALTVLVPTIAAEPVVTTPAPAPITTAPGVAAPVTTTPVTTTAPPTTAPPVPPTSTGTTYTYAQMASQPSRTLEDNAVVVNGLVYAFGGYQPNVWIPSNHAYVYNPATNVWTALLDMPNGGVTHLGIASDGTSIYYAGGYPLNGMVQAFATNLVWRYDIAQNKYFAMPNLPQPRGAGELQLLDGKLHYIGGATAARDDATDHWVLDLSDLAAGWTTAAPLPTAANHVGSAILNGLIYVVGGQQHQDDAAVPQAGVVSYDPATNTWTTHTSLPFARSHIGSTTFAQDGRIIVAGGEVKSTAGVFSPVHDVIAYDPATNAWTALTPLPSVRRSGIALPLGSGRFMYSEGDAGPFATYNGDFIATPVHPAG